MAKLIAWYIIRREHRPGVYWHSARSLIDGDLQIAHTLTHCIRLRSQFLFVICRVCAIYYADEGESRNQKKNKTQQNGQMQYGTRSAIASWCARTLLLFWFWLWLFLSFAHFPIHCHANAVCVSVYESNGASIWIAMNARRRWIHISIRFTSSSSGRCHRIIFSLFISYIVQFCK